MESMIDININNRKVESKRMMNGKSSRVMNLMYIKQGT